MATTAEDEKRAAAEAAAKLPEDGMRVGLGTGSTVAYLLPALADRHLHVRCVATSPRTEAAAREGWLVKGGGGAHTREKIVAAAAERFVVIADSSKPVDAITPPVPLELHPFGMRATLHELGDVRLRDWPPSPDGGVIGDYEGDVGDPAALAERLAAIPGVVEHGLFPAALVSDVLIARGGEVERKSV
jgi:ribose 5-phosphate isomerase A